MLLSGCVPQKKVIPPSPEQAKIEAALEQAQRAWQERDYPLAEERCLALLEAEGPHLNPRQRRTIRKRLAVSAARNGHYPLAEQNLALWKDLQPDVAQTWEWQSLYIDVLNRSQQMDRLLAHLEELLLQDPVPFAVKLKSTLALSRSFMLRHQFGAPRELLQTLYPLAGPDQQKLVGQSLTRLLQELDTTTLTGLTASCPADQVRTFPCSLFFFVSIQKRFQKNQLGRLQARLQLTSIYQTLDPGLQEALAPELKEIPLAKRLKSIQTALLVPLSGPYSAIGWKIAIGADVAQWQLLQEGVQLKVRIINTASSEWMEELSQLPKDCALIGGPLRRSIWREIHNAGFWQQNTFFTFRSSLPPGIEGNNGYRFFPSRQDQIRHLVQVLSQEIDIHQFGIIYPKSDYGRTMAKAFSREVRRQQGEITGLSGYATGAETDYRGLTADFLRVPEHPPALAATENAQEQNCTLALRPTPDFQAVFIPDSFSAARRIIPEFFFFDEYRMVFLGPTPWSQQIQQVTDLVSSYYKLALIPGAWWPENPGPATNRLRQGLKASAQGDPDFWTALGYDFIRFSTRLVDDLGQGPIDLNTALASMSGFSWSMASIHWDSQGRARQELFVFQLSGDKLTRISLPRLSYRRDRMREEYEYVLFNLLEEQGCFPEKKPEQEASPPQTDTEQDE